MAPTESTRTSIGVIADTHGHFDPLVLDGLRRRRPSSSTPATSSTPPLWLALETVAPVTVVPGNLDTGKLARQPREVAGVGGRRCLRRRAQAQAPAQQLPPARSRACSRAGSRTSWCSVTTTSRRSEWVDGTLYLNPGTASSPHEEDDDPTIAVVTVEPTGLGVRFVPLVRSEEALTG